MSSPLYISLNHLLSVSVWPSITFLTPTCKQIARRLSYEGSKTATTEDSKQVVHPVTTTNLGGCSGHSVLLWSSKHCCTSSKQTWSGLETSSWQEKELVTCVCMCVTIWHISWCVLKFKFETTFDNSESPFESYCMIKIQYTHVLDKPMNNVI